jgi:hypothetical protein
MLERAQDTLDERPPDGGPSPSGLTQITWHRRRYRRAARRRRPTYALRRPDPPKGDQRETEVDARSRATLPESAVVVGPHSPPRWIYERAICMAARLAYGQPVIKTVGAADMSGASV